MPLRRPGPGAFLQLKTEVIVVRRRVPLRRSVPLPRGLPPKRRVPVRKMRLRPRRGPDRSPDYLAWIRTLGCAVCSRVGGGPPVSEGPPPHVLGPGGLGKKTSDFWGTPFSPGHPGENWVSSPFRG